MEEESQAGTGRNPLGETPVLGRGGVSRWLSPHQRGSAVLGVTAQGGGPGPPTPRRGVESESGDGMLGTALQQSPEKAK